MFGDKHILNVNFFNYMFGDKHILNVNFCSVILNEKIEIVFTLRQP
jgi:hypothetical protein